MRAVGVAPRVVEDVGQRIARVAGGGDLHGVVAVGKHAATAPHDAVEPLGHPDAESLHALAEHALVGRLANEVDVVALDRVVDDAKEPRTGVAKRPIHHFVNRARA